MKVLVFACLMLATVVIPIEGLPQNEPVHPMAERQAPTNPMNEGLPEVGRSYHDEESRATDWSSCGGYGAKHFATAAGGRIVGGSQAATDQFPWQVSLQRSDWNGHHFCGATILTSKFLLTARHCVCIEEQGGECSDGWTTKEFNCDTCYARIGTTDKNTGAKISFKRVYHDGKGKWTAGNDIVVVELAQEIVFSKSVRPACLPDAAPKRDATVYISGWGSQKKYGSNGGPYPTMLQWQATKIVSQEDAEAAVPGIKFAQFIPASKHADGKGACSGDSGGPMVTDKSGRIDVIGVASFVNPKEPVCAVPGAASGFYTNVYSFKSWILGIIGSGASANGNGGGNSALSCKNRCGKEYDETKTCQCDSDCGSAGDCCADKASVCGGSG